MAVVFDAVAVVAGSNVTTITTAAFTISGADRAAILGWGKVINNTASGFTSSVGGVSGALISGTDSTTTVTDCRALLHGVTAPPTGSQTATMSWTTSSFASFGVCTATGVDQTTSFNNGTFNTGTSTAPTVTITSATNDMTQAGLCANDSGAITASSQTERYNSTASANIAGSTAAGAASNIHSWTIANIRQWANAGANYVQVSVSAFVTRPIWPIAMPV